jgi:hypothetical protein
MAYATINDPSAHFQTLLYTGGSSSYTNNGNSDLQPDWVWIKARNNAYEHKLFDSSRGTTKLLVSNSNVAEATQSGLTAFNSDGFSLGGDGGSNDANTNFVAWQWKANGGTTASNSDGSVTSTVQANTTAGFSIVKYTATGSGDITVGHGLGAVPEMILTKTRSVSYDWRVYISANGVGGAGKALQLDGNAALATNNSYPSPAPTSTVMTMGRGSDDNNNYANGETLVSYCFRSIKGYSKIGVYKGNGNTNGPFIYTGFKPAWLLTKRSDASDNWRLVDSTRYPFNDNSATCLLPNQTNNETNSGARNLDLLSNGFKVRTTDPDSNSSDGGSTYIYIAFAQNPLVASNDVIALAR